MEGPINNNEATNEISEGEDILAVEKILAEELPVQEFIEIFGKETYLIGGVVRDVILHKSIYDSDFDLMTRSSLGEVIDNLEKLGYSETTEDKFVEGKFSIKREVGVLNVLISGRQVQVGFIEDKSIDELTLMGDVNMNCCAFDLNNKRIINRDNFKEVSDRDLYFCNSELAGKDPMKILSALKQISRIPDLKVSEETEKIMLDSLQMLIDFFVENPNRRHKLKSIFGNINSGSVMKMFDGIDTKGIFDEFEIKRVKMNAPEGYSSFSMAELSEDVRLGIEKLIISQFGKRLNPEKIFNKKVNSVFCEISEGEVVSCALMDGERMYAVASASPERMIKMVSSLIKSNYNLWTTISDSRKYLIDMSKTAGLKLVDDPALIEKILVSNYPDYLGRIVVEKKGDHFVFTKKDSEDAPQALLMA